MRRDLQHESQIRNAAAEGEQVKYPGKFPKYPEQFY